MEKEWNYFQKLSLTFLFIYFLLYSNSTQFVFTFVVEPVWRYLVPKFAKLVGHDTPITVFTNGSGDTTYNYFQVLLFLIIAIVLSSVICLKDRKRINYCGLRRWLITFVRYYLAYQMINYGIHKLFYLQFPYPSVLRLEQELGDFSPMGLLWTFMGYSKGYTMFTGALEFIGGILLLSRKTSSLGALTTFGVMLNVMMLNYCYDVPVKLLSTHMVVMALYLISIDIKRISQFFFKNEHVASKISKDVVPEKFVKTKDIIKWAVIIAHLGYSFYQADQLSYKYGANAAKPIFSGKYTIEIVDRKSAIIFESDQNGSEMDKWKTFTQGWEGYATIKTKENTKINYNFEPDSLKKSIRIKRTNESEYYELKYAELANERFHLYGIYKRDSVRILMRKEDISQKTLVNRKFHWINEYPYNR